ncbi:site-2 protease family protein [Bremerella sp. P1]|uniref:site-2 protease family protein n=1 Tax=Bremerella sp. P1 TaxID=3026424 RepID=UPI002367B292|nr:site-2 protease family protein [Bremerella sp. P1]WDI43639.1 HlyD family efflux transporter periplasmic adaptor subunit [Bremerella sp. P1]
MATATLQSEPNLRSEVRVRPDLIYARRAEDGEETWVVKDPVTLRYFYFGPSEVYIMRRIDGHSSLASIKEQYDEDFAPHRISQQEILGFCHSLYQRGLLVAPAENQAEGLLERRQKHTWMQRASLPLQILAIRLPGVDPERFLAATHGAVDWLFQRATVIIVLFCAAMALLLGLINIESITARLPQESQFFRGENLVVLLVTFALVKVLHELGHAYCCKAMGGECHQIGVLLMVFTPAMYCDVSDAWLFPKRWQRVFVSAAGMYVEVILATTAFVLWFFSEPGAVSDWLLNVVFVCGVSTIVVNANPLLRYDGYYILSDMLHLPNLSSRASDALWTPIKNWFYRYPQQVMPEPRAATLRTYAVLAIIYRTMVFGFIFWFLYKACRQNDILPLWHMVAAMFVAGLLLKPAIGLVHWLRRPKGRGDAMVKSRVAIAVGVIVLVGCGLAMIPVPSRIHVPVISEIDSDHRVYVQVDGRVIQTADAEQKVAEGDVLAVLKNEDLEADLLKTDGEIAIQRQHLESLELRSNNNPEAAAQIPTAESALEDLQQQRQVLQRQLDQLTIRAPADGVVIPAPHKVDQGDSDRFLVQWSGSPLDEKNRGCLLRRGELLCLIGDAHALQARLFVDQDQIELIRVGDPVSILFDGNSIHSIQGTVNEISTDQSVQIPRNLSANPALGLERKEDGTVALIDGAYSVTVVLDETSPQEILPGTCGRAVVVGRTQTLWQIVSRFIQLNFRFFA